MTTGNDKAVLLMAYGTPEHLTDVEAYFTHIRGGRRPTPEAVERLTARYARVGGGTPLRRITEATRDGLEEQLAAADTPRRVYVGMKHWHPYVAESMRQMADDGIRDITAVTLAPHYSRMSVGAYRHAVEEAAAELGAPFTLRFVDRWHAQPRFLALMTRLVRQALERFPEADRDGVMVVFTAHSLPVRIREWGDPYEAELLESSARVAELAGVHRWRFAWQSAGGTQEPWIGPDILTYLEELYNEGVRNVLQVPIGFVSDHLEILYDIDIEAKDAARARGMWLERTDLPNASPELVRVLVDVVQSAESAPHPGG